MRELKIDMGLTMTENEKARQKTIASFTKQEHDYLRLLNTYNEVWFGTTLISH